MNEPVPFTVEAVGRRRTPETRPYDAEKSLADILEVATAEFADKGLAGARIDEIAAATRTSKRMIYYHFESKEALYIAVLEEMYRRFNEAESELVLDESRPIEALTAVTR